MVRLGRGLLLVVVWVLPVGWVSGQQTQNYELRAVPAPGAVRIDGGLTDWDLSGRILMCEDLNTGKESQSAQACAMYDAESLYLAIAVKDPTPLQNRADPTVHPSEGWKGDCVQVRMFAPGDRTGRIIWLDSWYYRPGKKAVMRLTHHGAKPEEIDGLTAGGAVAFRRDADAKGYVQEMRIPWRLLTGGASEVKPGLTFRMGIEVFGGGPEAFHIADLIDRKGASTRHFYEHPENWGRAA